MILRNATLPDGLRHDIELKDGRIAAFRPPSDAEPSVLALAYPAAGRVTGPVVGREAGGVASAARASSVTAAAERQANSSAAVPGRLRGGPRRDLMWRERIRSSSTRTKMVPIATYTRRKTSVTSV